MSRMCDRLWIPMCFVKGYSVHILSIRRSGEMGNELFGLEWDVHIPELRPKLALSEGFQIRIVGSLHLQESPCPVHPITIIRMHLQCHVNNGLLILSECTMCLVCTICRLRTRLFFASRYAFRMLWLWCKKAISARQAWPSSCSRQNSSKPLDIQFCSTWNPRPVPMPRYFVSCAFSCSPQKSF
jgi:hypothetical protein